MHRSDVWRVGLAFLVLGRLALMDATAQNAPAAKAEPPRPSPRNAVVTDVGLRVEAAPEITLTAPNLAARSFAPANLLDTPQLEQVFTLRNAGRVPLILDRFKSSCGCTRVFLAGMEKGESEAEAGGEALGQTLKPEQEMRARVAIDLTALPPGPFQKTVSVYAQGTTRPVALLTLTGTLLPSVTFRPALLDFGQAAPGQARPVLLTVSYDPRLTANGPLPPLFSTNPDVRIAPVRTNPNSPPAPLPAGQRAETFAVTLVRESPLGFISGSIAFQPGLAVVPAVGALQPSALRLHPAFLQATALLTGQVTGDVVAEPPVAAFGNAPLGRASMRQIVLTGLRPEALANFKIASASLWVTARLLDASLPAPGANRPTALALELILSPEAPAGVLQTQVKITLANGQRLLIPITAYVTASPAMP